MGEIVYFQFKIPLSTHSFDGFFHRAIAQSFTYRVPPFQGGVWCLRIVPSTTTIPAITAIKHPFTFTFLLINGIMYVEVGMVVRTRDKVRKWAKKEQERVGKRLSEGKWHSLCQIH